MRNFVLLSHMGQENILCKYQGIPVFKKAPFNKINLGQHNTHQHNTHQPAQHTTHISPIPPWQREADACLCTSLTLPRSGIEFVTPHWELCWNLFWPNQELGLCLDRANISCHTHIANRILYKAKNYVNLDSPLWVEHLDRWNCFFSDISSSGL